MSLSSVLVLASDVDAASRIVKDICKTDEIKPESQDSGISKYLWTIKNKYYTADVNLCTTRDEQSIDQELLDSVEAVIIYIQNSKGEDMRDINRWKLIINNNDAEVRILLCDDCNDKFPRDKATLWCLDHGFELTELLEKPDDDDDAIIADSFGIDRVISSLHSHTWSCLIRTDNFEPNEPALNDSIQENENDLEYMDEFCKLFAQMSETKLNSSCMPPEQRKAYAEQVVTAFWKAIGGDDEEIEDIIDD